MQSHLGRLTVDTNAARSHHHRAISEPTSERPHIEDPLLVPSNGPNSLRPRSTSNYAAAAVSPRFTDLSDGSPYQLGSTSIAHLSPAAHTILLNNVRPDDAQPQSPVAFSPVGDEAFEQNGIAYPTSAGKAWSLYQGDGPKHERPSTADLDFRPRSAVSEPGRDSHDHSQSRSNMRYERTPTHTLFASGTRTDTLIVAPSSICFPLVWGTSAKPLTMTPSSNPPSKVC